MGHFPTQSMPRGRIAVVRVSVGWSSSFFGGGVYEFGTSAPSTAVDTRHVSSSGDLDPLGKVESDPFWPYKKGDALRSFLLKNFLNITGDSASLRSHFSFTDFLGFRSYRVSSAFL